jgi:hypothetical protein
VQVGGQSPGRGEVVSERLLDHHARRRRQIGLRQALDHRRKQGRRDLQIEHRVIEAFDGSSDALICGRITEITLNVGQLLDELVEGVLVERLTSPDDGLAGALHQLVPRPVVDRHSDDRAGEKTTLLQSIQRAEGHHSGKIPGDTEYDQDICYSIGGSFDSRRHDGLRLCEWRTDVPTSKARKCRDDITPCG